jgi:NADH:ubiquinone oxidoreductase subunit
MLTPKFWKLVKKEGIIYFITTIGFMQTYLRNHRASRSSHYAGGTTGPVECVGQDEFGNRYYEDFDVSHRGHRRWVEYSDYFMGIGITGDRVPPGILI